MNDVRRYQLIAVLAAILALTVAFIHPKETSAPTNNGHSNSNTNSTINSNGNVNADNSVLTGQTFYTADLPEADPAYKFSIRLMSGWVVEYNGDSRRIEITNPDKTGTEKTQILIGYYRGTVFAVPGGSPVGEETNTTVAGQSARRMTVTPNDMTGEDPGWGRTAHLEVDIIAPATTDGLHYRFDFSPLISATLADEILSSLNLSI